MTQQNPFRRNPIRRSSTQFPGFSPGFGDFPSRPFPGREPPGQFIDDPIDPTGRFPVPPGQDQSNGSGNNPFLDFLEEERNFPFQAALRSQNLTPNQLQFFQKDRQNIFDRFDALLGQDILSGQTPSRKFTDFIGDFDFGREFQLTPQAQRPGGSQQRFNPRTAFLR